MIKGKDVYDVVAALVPLYVALFLAYGSVRWWKIFSPEQCSGINRFVSVFAVPFLSFHFISNNNPYTMNFRFLAADCLQKVVILAALFLWNTFTKWGSIDWTITLFSLSTLPNTLIMGVPLLKAMYGDFTATLMIQIVVFQSVIWYTLLLFMFEYRGAKLLISEQFPDTAGAIASLRVDSSVSSLNGREPLHADAEIGENGELHVVLRSMSRSTSLSMPSSFHKSYSTPRPSNAAFVDMPQNMFWRSKSDGCGVSRAGFVYSYPSQNLGFVGFDGGFVSSHIYPKPEFPGFVSGLATPYPSPKPVIAWSDGGGQRKAGSKNCSYMFGCSLNASSNSDVNQRHEINRVGSFATIGPSKFPLETAASKEHELVSQEVAEHRAMGKQKEVKNEEVETNKNQQMPRANVMIKLILIMVWRNLIRNPNTYASVLGLIWSLIFYRWSIKVPSIIKGSIEIISNTGLGMAMFSLGLFMALQPKIITCGKTLAALAFAIKFLVGPFMILAASKIIGIHGVLLRITIVQAALPQGIVPFVFAKEYNLHADVLSTAVVFGMVVALPVTIIYYVVLGL
ncbi:auxin efflux carrier component 2-like [Vigna radiata var. radiata]|uniref:Auxin efflux carrier component n=1 Tax=Vigna radiata var. radiata TaxID=3916 RepID=A0A1S3TYZ4_VIGRR|nr:auxin efflux carrier component 2-like [Vigna radiata var. radiata]